jgi:phospholipid/cholesterol/gamma-HCH transport system ATP-binding protein
MSPVADDTAPVIAIEGLTSRFGSRVIHEGLDVTIMAGEIVGVVGGSGSGKSVLLNTILGLKPIDAGVIRIFGTDLATANRAARTAVDRRWGVLFQRGALFSNLSVGENVEAPMVRHGLMSRAEMRELAALKIALVGLPPHAIDLKPSELSGGMIKRAALARALALDPELLFLDEPTSGLDPIGAGAFDELIADLSASLGLTVFMITHDLDSLYTICDSVAVLADKKIVAKASARELETSTHPWVQAYFCGPRGRAAAASVAASLKIKNPVPRAEEAG